LHESLWSRGWSDLQTFGTKMTVIIFSYILWIRIFKFPAWLAGPIFWYFPILRTLQISGFISAETLGTRAVMTLVFFTLFETQKEPRLWYAQAAKLRIRNSHPVLPRDYFLGRIDKNNTMVYNNSILKFNSFEFSRWKKGIFVLSRNHS